MQERLQAPLWTSECPPELAEFYRQCCLENEEAFLFLLTYHQMAHAVDDMVDEGGSAQALLNMLVLQKILHAMPFYRKNEAALEMVWTLAHNAYADSVDMEKGSEAQRAIADVIRFAGNEMVRAVAYICGGWNHLRAVSPMLWALSWKGHHDGDGKGI